VLAGEVMIEVGDPVGRRTNGFAGARKRVPT